MRLQLSMLYLLFISFSVSAQGTLEDYKNAIEIRSSFNKVYGIPQQIVWSEDGHSFSYRNMEKGNKYMMYLVDVSSKDKIPIEVSLVSQELSKALSKAIKLESNWGKSMKTLNNREVEFIEEGFRWKWHAKDKKLSKLGEIKSDKVDSKPYWGAVNDDSQGLLIISPDKQHVAFIQNNNVYIRKQADANSSRPLTYDGSPGEYYSSTILWSADSKKIAVSKVRKADIRQLTLLESSPVDQLQPKLHSRDYRKPGDALSQYYPAIIDVESGVIFSVDPSMVSNQYAVTNIGWCKDNSAIRFEFNKRGHQQYDLLELDAISGKTKALISEQSGTFVDYSYKKFRFDNPSSHEIIWASERDGWNHLYLFDAKTGNVKNQITKGNWLVRSVIDIDTLSRSILFEASGMSQGEDPYLIHYYRINFDGENLKELTTEEANHRAVFNPAYTLFVDTYSLVNKAPISVLRNAKDGSVVMNLEEADITELESSGWRAPEVFSAVGRDGHTDIWGIIIRPRNFDINKKYPVIEYIYAGPHSSFVPKSFTVNPAGMYELAELGFIVVQIDGMGTSNRSKAFHNVAWKNLKDAGFPDRIAWMKSAHKKYPYMDLERVGIYGTSAGGQSSTGGVLFHPEFYKVAVSSCGCHDNRLDKIWWNEQWMGWPIGPQYAECSNVENAYRLQGKLMLIVGELDDNVDPSSTFQLVNALIKQGKDHEFIMVPGMGHANGGDFGERKRRDFFVKNLIGIDPPTWDQY